MKEQGQIYKIIALDVLLSGNKMDKLNNKNFFQIFQDFIKSNFKIIISILLIFFILFLCIQFYNYNKIKNFKEKSILTFNALKIDNEDLLISKLNKINKNNDFYNILSDLKLIQIYNNNKNYDLSNIKYKEILESSSLDELYISAIATHAAYTFIEATFNTNSNKFIKDIQLYIDSISENLENYNSIKLELKYLLLVTEIDLNKTSYKDNLKVKELYNSIYNSNSISESVKERIRKIHEFQIYK